MPIDWFTVVAQILNFLVLVWILKRLLYKPVLRAIAERQDRVQKSILEAEAAKKEAAAERAKFEEQNRKLDEGREAAMQQMRAEAETERKKRIDDARAEFDAARAHWRQALASEQDEFQQALAREAHGEVIGIANRLLRDLADTDLQERILEKFLRKIAGLDEAEKATLRDAMATSGNRCVTVRSAFDLPAERREAIIGATQDVLGTDAPVEFETKPSLGCGVELTVDGHKIAWTLEDYLRSLDLWVSELVSSQQQQPHE